MFGKGPKTLKGMMRKAETGDGRKKTYTEKLFDGEIDPFTGKSKKTGASKKKTGTSKAKKR